MLQLRVQMPQHYVKCLNIMQLRFGATNTFLLNKIYFSQFWRLESLKSRCWHICCVVRAHFLGHRWQFCRLWWKGQGSRLRPLRSVLIPLGKPCPHELITFQRLHHLKIRISLYKFCWDTNIWSVALCEL